MTLTEWCKLNNKNLLNEWDYEKNDSKPDEFAPFSNKKVWWKCKKGHNWEAVIGSRTNRNRGCPYCSNQKLLVGFNDLATTNPQLASEWNYSKNEGLLPTQVSSGSEKKVWWLGQCGHEWEATIQSRNRGNGCPYCSGQLVLKGYNDFESNYPEYAKEWDYEKNDKLPSMYAKMSGAKVWWKCEKGHEWQARINSRVGQGNGCPYCSGRKAIKNETDLTVTNPGLMEEWDYEKNSVSPHTLKGNSRVKVWWKCKKCGESWEALVSNRTALNRGCPYCEKKIIRKGETDLESLYPYLAKEWNFEKNKGIKPSEVFSNSGKKYWWKCNFCGYEWETAIYNRTKGHGCPQCNLTGTSMPEQIILFYLKKHFNDAISREKICNYEIDIYLPSIKTGIEFDGIVWHKNKTEKDELKNKILKENGIRLIRVRDRRLPKLSNCEIVSCDDVANYSEYNSVVKELLTLLNVSGIEVDIDKDYYIIYSNAKKNLKEKSILYTNPELAKDWDEKKNDPLKIYQVSPGARIKAWWKCHKCGYEWQAFVYSRARGNGCNNCGQKQAIITKLEKKIKSQGLLEHYPRLVKEWNYDKNKDIDLSRVHAGQGIKVWWKCSKCGCEWQSYVNSRAKGREGCPVCTREQANKKIGRKVLNVETGEIFDSLKAAADKYNGSNKTIQGCCSGKIKSAYGYHWKYMDTNGRNNNRARKILNVETNEVFDSAIEAAKKYNLNRISLSQVLNGRSKTAGGYHWKYIKEK